MVVFLLTGAACTEEAAQATTTSSTSTTEATTTSSSTTTSTSTTVDPIAEAEAAVEAAYYRSYEVFVDCYRTLPDCDPEEAFAEVYTGGTYERLAAGAVQRKADGLIFEPAENPDYARTEVLGVTVNSDATEAVLSFCTFADDTEYALGPDGDRTLVDPNETVLVEWGDALYILENDGVWRIYDYVTDEAIDVPYGEIDERVEEGTLCGGPSQT